MKSLLEAVRRLPPASSSAVLALVPAPVLAQVTESSGMDWLPLEANLVATHAVHRALGEEAFRAFFREFLHASFEGPLFRTVVAGAIRLFGMDPGDWAGWVGKGWTLVFKECGRWVVERHGEREALLRMEALPGELAGDGVWLRSVAASLEAFFLLAKAPGEARVVEHDPVARTARLHLAWGPSHP
jgi:hypothetical protein